MKNEKCFRFPIREAVRFPISAPKEDADDLSAISDRLRLLCKKKREPSSSASQTSLIIQTKGNSDLCSSLRSGLEGKDLTYIATQPEESRDQLDAKAKQLYLSDEKRIELEALTVGAEKMVIQPKLGKKAAKKLRQKERDKTKGSGWFDMAAPEVTEETKRDLEVLQMRSALDPKRFYKKNDLQVLPKYFQVGQVIDSPVDFYTNRVSKKNKKKTLVDELMADAEFKKYNKRKYAEILEEKEKTDRRYAFAAKKKKHMEAKRKRKEAKK